MDLNKEQTEKATRLLGLLCENESIDNVKSDLFFANDKEDALIICKTLEDKNLLKVNWVSDNKVGGLKRKENTCHAFKSDQLMREFIRHNRVEEMEQLEISLAKSNIEANELNKKIALQNSQNESKNRIAMWVNISVGVLNIVLLAIQIWLIVCKS